MKMPMIGVLPLYDSNKKLLDASRLYERHRECWRNSSDAAVDNESRNNRNFGK